MLLMVLPLCLHRFADKEVQRDAKMVSYKVVDKTGKPYVSVDIAGEEKTYSPEEISAMVLTKVSASALHLQVAECRALLIHL